MQTIRKTAVILLLAALVLPLNANYRLRQIVEDHSSLKDETVSSEIASILEKRTGIQITKHAIVSHLSKLCYSVFYMHDFEEPEEPVEYAFTLPYLTDDTVLITRSGEDIDITKEIIAGNSSKIYAGFKNDIIFTSWLADSNFHNINEDSKTLADALELIISREADFTILPSHMAQHIIEDAGLSYSLTTSRTLFPIEYRIPVEIDDTETLVLLNDELLKLESEGTLTDIYFRKGIKSNAVLEQESQILKPAVLNILLLFFCILSIIYFIRYYSNYRKVNPKANSKKPAESGDGNFSMSLNEKITLLTNKNSSISAQIAENKNTDPYSGFYNTQYFNGKINDCFISYAKKGVPFTILVIDTNRKNISATVTMDSIKNEISRLLTASRTEAIAAHNGFGIFYVLFPDVRQDDALCAINAADCRFNNFSLVEYKGQDQYEFLGGLGL